MSLQEQLLKAGLADKSKLAQIKKQKHKARKQKQAVDNEGQKLAQSAREEKAARDRELNAQRQLEAQQKAITAQIRQIIQMNRVARDNGDIACNFTDGSLVKRLFVDQKTHKLVTQGRLTVVKLDDSYELIPTPAADKIRERDASYIIYCAEPTAEQQDSAEEDDWYKDFEVPDDLMW